MTAALGWPRSTVPAGSKGDWVVDRYEIASPSPGTVDNRPAWTISPPGVYTRLRCGDVVFMTDQHDEWWTQRTAITEAVARGGRVLVTGLGLGLVVQAILDEPSSKVKQIVIVEKSTEVIGLVAPHLIATYGERVCVVEGDAFTWDVPAGETFTVGWHDIWPNPQGARCEDEEAALVERYLPVCDWQGTWSAQWRADEAESVVAMAKAGEQRLT